jgi:hypothetical protein
MVVGLVAATGLLLVFFATAAHVKVIVAVGPPLGPAGATGTINAVATSASLAGVLRGDEGVGRPGGGARPIVALEAGVEPSLPAIYVASPSWSPFFVAQLVWSSCLPAAGLLGLRFFFLPFTMRRLLGATAPASSDLRISAAIAADASIATAGLAGALATIAISCAAFLAALVAPSDAAVAIASLARPTVFAFLLALPPILVARAVASDGARRVFPGPVRAAIALVLAYAAGLGCAIAVIGLTFSLASRLLV